MKIKWMIIDDYNDDDDDNLKYDECYKFRN